MLTLPTRSFKTALVPICLTSTSQTAFVAAQMLAAEVILVGVVPIAEDQSVSAATPLARKMRQHLAALASDSVRFKSPVIVSSTPWKDLQAVITDEEPDVVIVDWAETGLGFSAQLVLVNPICNVVVVRGPLPTVFNKILVAVRGGPYAELALQSGLSLHATQLDALHIALTGATDAPFKGLKHILKHMPEVNLRSISTDDAARSILEESRAYDIVVIGATANQSSGSDRKSVV